MHLIDYLRLSWAAIRAHKKRAITVMIITGVLFSVIAAGYFVIQGLEDQVFAIMLTPTDGKILVTSTVDTEYCEDECDVDASVAEMKNVVRRYGGTVLDSSEIGMVQTEGGLSFVRMDGGLFRNVGGYDGDAPEVLLSIMTAMNLFETEVAAREAPADEKVATIERARERTIGKVVRDGDGVEYYVAGVLPGGTYQTDISFAVLGRESNPLNFLLSQMNTGVSRDFLLGSAESVNGMEMETPDTIFAYFDNIEQAYEYYKDGFHSCEDIERVFHRCAPEYAAQMSTLIGNPLQVYDSFQTIWQGYNIFAVVLTIIALIIMISTYSRLIGKDTKIISLYYAMGATGVQVRLVYLGYLLLLSLMTTVFATMTGMMMALVLSLVNLEPLRQVFVIGLGIATRDIWLVGWDWAFAVLAGCMLLGSVVTILLCNGQFRGDKLSRGLK